MSRIWCGWQPPNGINPALWAIAFIAVCSFWSTALVEIGSLSLILVALIRPPSIPWLPKILMPLVFWGVYILCVILSILLSPNIEATLRSLGTFWHTIIFPIAFLGMLNIRDVSIPGKLFVLSAGLASAATLAVFVTGQQPHLKPLTGGLTTFSTLLALAGPVAIFQFVNETDEKARSSRILALLLYGLIVLAVSFTARLSAMVVLVVGSLIVLSINRPRWTPIWILFIVLIAAVSPHALLHKVLWVVTGGETDRYVLWRSVPHVLSNLPFFGNGPGSFQDVLPAGLHFDYRPPSGWHNDYIQTVLESGWLAGVTLVAGVVIVNWVLLSRVVRTPPGHRRNSYALLLSMTAGLSLTAAVSSVIWTAVLGTIWWLVFGGVVGFLETDDSQGTTKERQN